MGIWCAVCCTLVKLMVSHTLCFCYSVCVCRFPSCHFGKLYGLVMALSAVVSLLQYPCFALVKGALGGDPLYVSTFYTLYRLLLAVDLLSWPPTSTFRWTLLWRCSACWPSSTPSTSICTVGVSPLREPAAKPNFFVKPLKWEQWLFFVGLLPQTLTACSHKAVCHRYNWVLLNSSSSLR